MSLSSTVRRNSYIGNGAVSVYSYTFKIFLTSELKVQIVDSTGVTPIVYNLTLGTDYSVQNAGVNAGGSITLIVAGTPQAWFTSGKLTTGLVIIIEGNTNDDQPTSIRNQGPYFPDIHEDVFDRLTMLVQQLTYQIGRAIKMPFNVNIPSDFNPNLPVGSNNSSNAGAALVFASDGKSLVLGPVLTGGSVYSIYNAIVGAETGCNYATLASALAASSPGWRILVLDSATIDTGGAFVIAQNNILIEFSPNATYSKGTLTGYVFDINASGVRIKGARLLNFDIGVQVENGKNNNFVTECRFANCTQEINDVNTAPNNIYQMNISE